MPGSGGVMRIRYGHGHPLGVVAVTNPYGGRPPADRRNTDGKDNAGVLTFHKIADQRTRVMEQMDSAPEGVKDKIGGALRFDDGRVEADRARFKELVEIRGASGGWRGEVRPALRRALPDAVDGVRARAKASWTH